jgi:DNA-binding GntR family transcriptional regulator
MAKNIRQTIYESLVRRITLGEIPQGTFLTEVSLASLFKASRTPVREACIKLLQEGFLRPTSGKGFAVTELTLDTVRELYQLRLLLEPFAAESAARMTLPDEFFATCAKANEACGPDIEPTFEAYFRRSTAEGQLHCRIARASGNEKLAKIVADLLNQHRRFHYATFSRRLAEGIHWTAEEHEGILHAIRRHDSGRARTLMFEHIQAGAERSFRYAMGFASAQPAQLDHTIRPSAGLRSTP